MAFYTILTEVGKAKLANATALGTVVELTEIAVGDGDGVAITLVEADTALTNEVWRAALNNISIDAANGNWIVAEGYIPSDVGGFTVREVALFDVDGDMIAIGNYPDTYKPTLDSGSAKDLYIKVVIEVTNVDTVELKIDPAVVLASREYVNDEVLAHYKMHQGHKNLLINTELRINQEAYANGLVLANVYTYDMFIAQLDNSGISSTGVITGVMAQFIEESDIVNGSYTFSNADCDVTVNGVTKTTPCTFDIVVAGNVEVRFSNGNLKNIQMEAGTIATNKELRPTGVELDLTQRHFQYNPTYTIRLWLSGNTTLGSTLALIKSMRVTPVVNISTITYTNASSLSVIPSSDHLIVSFIGISDTGGSRVNFNYTADARIYY